MDSPSELSLDYKPNTYPMIQKPFGDQPEQTQKLEDYLARLEEERLKIEAFKRELPLCMQLLNNAMETYRQQLETHQRNQGPRPVLEEFLPLRNISINGSEKTSTASSEKASWMVSAQLWSPASDPTKQQPLTAVSSIEAERSFDVSPKLALDSKRNGGAFLPFSREKNKGLGSASRVLPDLALTSSEKEVEEKKCLEIENGGMGVRRENGSKVATHEQGKRGSNTAEGQAAAQSTHRKARRCWSADLHRRFVNALQMLGGSQVATPKQIRELMKVDGLTNDEVKSHLQKYRLHTRRPIPPPQPTATAAPQLVVLGGIWVPHEYATSAAAAAGPTIYGAHPTPAHFSVPQEFYPPPAPHHHHHHHHLHHPLHRSAVSYKGRLPSPESELRNDGDRSESIEEEEDGEEREDEEEEQDEEMEEEKSDEKALVPLESNGSGDVALKF